MLHLTLKTKKRAFPGLAKLWCISLCTLGGEHANYYYTAPQSLYMRDASRQVEYNGKATTEHEQKTRSSNYAPLVCTVAKQVCVLQLCIGEINYCIISLTYLRPCDADAQQSRRFFFCLPSFPPTQQKKETHNAQLASHRWTRNSLKSIYRTWTNWISFWIISF